MNRGRIWSAMAELAAVSVSMKRTCGVLAAGLVILAGGQLFADAASASEKEPAAPHVQQPNALEKLNDAALKLAAKGNTEEAIALWKQADDLAERSSPGNDVHLEILSSLALAYYNAGNQYYPVVQSYLDRIIEKNPNVWIVYLIQGDMCYENYQLECAAGNYDLLLRMNSRYKYAQRVNQRIEILNKKREEPPGSQTVTARPRGKYLLPVLVESDIPKFLLYLSVNEESFLTRIDIVREDQSFIHQTIKYEAGDVECIPPVSLSDMIVEAGDFNGDGFHDVKIACASGDTVENRFLYYLFHRRKLLFLPFAGGSLPDKAKGQGAEEIRIYKKTNGGRQPMVEAVYRFSAGKLVIVNDNEKGVSSR